MKKKILTVVCSLSIVVSNFFMTYKTFAAGSVIEFVESTIDEIVDAIADVTGAVASDPVYSGIKALEGTNLKFIEDLNLWVDINSYNEDTDDYDIAYGIALTETGGRGLARYGGGGGGSSRFVETADDIEFTGETFSEVCERLSEQYAPDAKTEYISWKKEVKNTGGDYLSFWAEGVFCNNNDWYDCYALPFIYDGERYYYGYFQYYFSQLDGVMYIDQYNVVDCLGAGLENYTPTRTPSSRWVDTTYYRYMQLRCVPYSYNSSTHKGRALYYGLHRNYTDYLNGTFSKIDDDGFGVYAHACDYIDSDLQTYCGIGDLNFFADNTLNSEYFAWVDGARDKSKPYDVGFFVSDSYIELAGYIQPIPVEQLENTTVTISGDTIYDYTITNNTTGDTSSVDYFITNNYTYENIYVPEDDDSDSGSSGGSASGDINVSGDIEVGGKVDININVEQGSSSTEDIKGYEYEEINLEAALEEILKMSTGFTNWFSRVFDFLPPELMGLLLGGITIAILLRIAGR